MERRAVVASLLALSLAGLLGIQNHEGMVHKVYLDPVGIPTACAGHTATVTKADVGKRMSDDVCRRLLAQDVSVAESAVRKYVKQPLTQGQYDAMVSFTFNVGAKNFANSTLLKQHNLGNCWGAGYQFTRWVYAKDKKLPGLVTRRADERKLYEADCDITQTPQTLPTYQRVSVQWGTTQAKDCGILCTDRVLWLLRRAEPWEVQAAVV
jgi:lysozyme